MNPYKRRAIFATLAAANPRPGTELHHGSTFELLISVILSAQATDISVNKATGPLYARANTAAAIYELGVEGLKPFIRTIGLYNGKAKNIIETCRILNEQYVGQVPENRAALEALPGVGRKTANVILNTAFGWPTIAVDTHIFRVGNRTGLSAGKNVLQVEQQLLQAVPKKYRIDAHHWLILHGRYTCLARRPKCGICPIERWCEFDEKTCD